MSKYLIEHYECPYCNRNNKEGEEEETEHVVYEDGHERDSSGCWKTCLVCGNRESGYTGRYQWEEYGDQIPDGMDDKTREMYYNFAGIKKLKDAAKRYKELFKSILSPFIGKPNNEQTRTEVKDTLKQWSDYDVTTDRKPESIDFLYPNKNKPEFIVCAAVWIKGVNRHPELNSFGVQPHNTNDGVVICGHRHHSAIILAQRFVDIDGLLLIDGFLTSKNRFVDRKEGAEIAFAIGQIPEKQVILTSEDLY